MVIFKGIFLILWATILYKELGFFALRSVHQDASFELSKTAFWEFFQFFTIENKSTFVNKITNGSRIQMVQHVWKAESKYHKNKNLPTVIALPCLLVWLCVCLSVHGLETFGQIISIDSWCLTLTVLAFRNLDLPLLLMIGELEGEGMML